MSSYDVDDKVAATLRQIIKTDYGILILRYDVVQPALVFEKIVYSRPVSGSPFGVAHDAGQGEAVALALLQHLLHAGKHSVPVEMTVAQINFVPMVQLELSTLFDRRDVDAA